MLEVIQGLFGLSVFITQYSVFITQYPNFVGPTTSCFVWMSFHHFIFNFHHSKNQIKSWKMKTGFITQNLIFSGMFVNRRRLRAPKPSHIPPITLSFLFFFSFFPFLLHFSFFLSFSLSILLQSKKLTHQPLTCTAFFLLSSDSMFFLFCSSPTSHSHADPRLPKLRDHRRRSSITRRKAPPPSRSPSRCYRTRSSIWPGCQNRHPQQ